jgi:REP element-mobilizing transposase RayT
MARPLRIEYPGAVYHVTARGNGGQAIFADAADAARLLALIGREAGQMRWRVHGYCLMENHYHLLVETPEPNLGRGMGRLNMCYAQDFARRHARPGHLFQGRYRAVLVEKPRWLAPLCRHVVLNPVRCGLVRRAEQWKWSSLALLDAPPAGDAVPRWVERGWLGAQFGGAEGWRDYVAAGADAVSPWDSLRGGQYLGGEAFLKDCAARLEGRDLAQVSRAAARPDRPDTTAVLEAVARAAGLAADAPLHRRGNPAAFDATVYLLRRAANLKLAEVAALGGVSPARISQIQRDVEDAGGLAAAFPWGDRLETLMRR